MCYNRKLLVTYPYLLDNCDDSSSPLSCHSPEKFSKFQKLFIQVFAVLVTKVMEPLVPSVNLVPTNRKPTMKPALPVRLGTRQLTRDRRLPTNVVSADINIVILA